jgi:tRNA A-37 threonylcarbamoyl transferase component Bud32
MIRILKDLQVLEGACALQTGVLSIELTESLRLFPGRREVYRGRLLDPEREVVVKCYWPHAKQARDWRREWDGLVNLQALNMPAPEALAVCLGAEQEVYVIMQCITGSDTLGAYLNTANASLQQQTMQRLAQLVDALHDAGAYQQDQHVDNWAVTESGLYLLDAGTYRFMGAPLDFAIRLADIAAICVTLPPSSERLFRLALYELYWGNHAERTKLLYHSLDAAILLLQQERARRYFKKTQRECTEFGMSLNKTWRGMLANVANSDLVREFFEDPDSFMQQGECLKDGNTCTVQRIRYADRSYVLKRYNQKPWPTRLRRAFFASRAQKSWSSGWLLKLAFIPTAEPVAYLEERRFPRGRSYLLMNEIEGRVLPEYLQLHGLDAARFDAVVEAVGQIWDALGRLRAVHGDLKGTNWIVGDDHRVFLFDLDSFRFALSERAFQRGREKDLKRFLKNWQSQPEWARAFRARMEVGAAK